MSCQVSHLSGMHHAIIPFPLQMEEDPIHVNAKQYHAILGRRQRRAMAMLEKKVTKVRKVELIFFGVFSLFLFLCGLKKCTN